MFKTLIVSDMGDGISFFSRLGNFTQHNLKVIGQVRSKSELVAKSQNENIQLYIVEEGFCGISFAEINEIIRTYNPNCEVIAIAVSDSPIREKNVISLGAFSYLRRPLASASFEIVLSGVEARINRNLSASFEQKPNTLKMLYLQGLISTPEFIQSNISLFDDIYVSLHKSHYMLIVINGDTYYHNKSLENFIKNKCDFEIFTNKDNTVAILSSSLDILKEIKSLIEGGLIPNTIPSQDIFISNIYTDLFESSTYYEKGVFALNEDNRKTVPLNVDKEKVERKINALYINIKNGEYDLLEKELVEIFLNNSPFSQEEKTWIIVKLVEKSLPLIGDNNSLAILNYKKLADKTNHKSSISLVVSLLIEIAKKQNKTKITSSQKLAEDCYEYLQINYMDNTLSVKTIADKLQISQNYLSTLIKKFYGDTFINILVKIRLEKAKELLILTNKRINEICEEVGYSDSHYFSYSFKRYFNMTPNQMRQGGTLWHLI